MSCLKARKGNIARVKHLQRADFKNPEMKRFVDQQKILAKDHRRSMCLINKEVQEVRKTLMDIKLTSGYCHQGYTAHLRSVSIAFSSFKNCKNAKKRANIDLIDERGDSVKSELKFDSMNNCLFDEDTGDRGSDMSKVDETVDTNKYKKFRSNDILLMKSKTCFLPDKDLKNSFQEVSSSRFDVLEMSSTECNGDAHPQKTSQASHNTKTNVKRCFLSPTRFTLHRRAAPVHQKLYLHRCPTPVIMKPSREREISKMLSRHFQDKDSKNNAISNISKAAMKRGLDLLIKEYNYPQNLLNKGKKSVLQDKVCDFVSELSKFNIERFGPCV